MANAGVREVQPSVPSLSTVGRRRRFSKLSLREPSAGLRWLMFSITSFMRENDARDFASSFSVAICKSMLGFSTFNVFKKNPSIVA